MAMESTTASTVKKPAATHIRIPGVGDPAPDALLVLVPSLNAADPTKRVEPAEVLLSALWAERPLVVVFLRHLGCIFCREQVARLRTDYQRFRQAGAEVACIAQGDYKVGKAFSLLMGLPFPMLMCGKETSLFRQYGLLRGNLWQLFGPSSIVKGFRALAGGHRQGKIVGDGFQMPGLFIVDKSGTIRFARRHVNAGDNPDNGELLAALATLGES